MRISALQAEGHIGAERGGDVTQPLNRPVQSPQGVHGEQCRRRVGGSAAQSGTDGNVLVHMQRHVRLPPRGPGDREQRKHRMVAAHVAAARCQITQMLAAQFEREPAAGGLGGRRHHVVDADGAIYRVQRVPAAPFLMGGPYVQRQIGFRGNRDLHRVQRPGRCRFRGCDMMADGPMRGDAWRTPHLTRCR